MRNKFFWAGSNNPVGVDLALEKIKDKNIMSLGKKEILRF